MQIRFGFHVANRIEASPHFFNLTIEGMLCAVSQLSARVPSNQIHLCLPVQRPGLRRGLVRRLIRLRRLLCREHDDVVLL